MAALGCSRYDYYPRGIHKSEKAQSGPINNATYIVKKGDTLYSIGKRYNTDYHLLAERNGIKKPYTLYVGQRVYTRGHAPIAEKLPRTKETPPKTVRPKQVASKSVQHPAASQGRVKLIWPAKGKLTSRFGPRKNRMHDGIDLAAEEGTEIMAAAAGRVVYADSRLSGYGNLIIVRHNTDMFTAYAHNKRNLVKRGDEVKAGQLIGYIGSTGRTSGSHLHFEVRRGETAVDPLAYLPRR